MGFVGFSTVVPFCLSLICACAIVILLVCLRFLVRVAQRLFSLCCRLTGGQTALIFVNLCYCIRATMKTQIRRVTSRIEIYVILHKQYVSTSKVRRYIRSYRQIMKVAQHTWILS